ncbi:MULTISPECIES: hypothetical protein [Xanthomonas]|uniref:hypothetical protein n=1 Tax=Xanthomonas TaxID=338 RepID=UPI0011B0ED70|nr:MULTISPECIES: hypothetical protein [Xanthomonas]MEA9566464.1 hypothetical protein [Xanthomonas sp. WHRI 8932A]
MKAFQTAILELLQELRVFAKQNFPEEVRDLLAQLIERLELVLESTPDDPDPEIDELKEELLAAAKALIEAIATYLASLTASPEQRGSALGHLISCLWRLDRALTAIENALRPRRRFGP